MEEMNIQRIKNEIMNLNSDSKFQRLNAYYNRTTVFNMLRAERSENRFSAFLCWLFNPESSHGLHELPLKKLLALYAFALFREPQAKLDPTKTMSSVFGAALMTGNYDIIDVEECTNEKVASSITEGKEHRRIDIWILIHATFDSVSYEIPVVIENKVYAAENDSQTKAYHEAVTIYKEKRTAEGVTVLPVEIYLTPDNPKPSKSEYFANITYQMLLDYVIEPLVGLTGDERSKIMISDFIKNLAIPTEETDDDNAADKKIKDKGNSILAISKKERTELVALYKEYKALYLAALCVVGGNRARVLFPDIEVQDAESIELLDNLWNSNFSLFTTILYVCRNEIAPNKEKTLQNIFKESHRDSSRYLVEIKDANGKWTTPQNFTRPMSKGKTVAIFFTLWKKNAVLSLDSLREAFPSSLNNCYYGNSKEKWGNSVVWELVEGEDDKVRNAEDKTHFLRTWVKAENGYSTKLSTATWDFYNEKEYGCHSFKGGKAYIVKMWRRDDFQNLLKHIDSNKQLFEDIRIREIKRNELS